MSKLKKVWAWVKKYWYIPAAVVVLVVLGIVYFLTKGRVKAVFQVLNKIKNDNRKLREELEKIDEESVEKQRKVDEQLDETLKKIEKKHKQKEESISTEEKKEVVKQVKKYKNDPEKLESWLKEEYGVHII